MFQNIVQEEEQENIIEESTKTRQEDIKVTIKIKIGCFFNLLHVKSMRSEPHPYIGSQGPYKNPLLTNFSLNTQNTNSS